MCIMMIILFSAVMVLLWKNYRIKKEAKLFAEKVEDALDAIVTGKEWNMEEELEDSLWGRTGTQLEKAEHVFRKKEEDGIREKERVKGLILIYPIRQGRPLPILNYTWNFLRTRSFRKAVRSFWEKSKGRWKKLIF